MQPRIAVMIRCSFEAGLSRQICQSSCNSWHALMSKLNIQCGYIGVFDTSVATKIVQIFTMEYHSSRHRLPSPEFKTLHKGPYRQYCLRVKVLAFYTSLS